MDKSTTPERPPWTRVLRNGRWIEITPGWILARLQEGLTPASCDAIALAANQIGVPVELLYDVALALVEDEAP